MNDCQFLWEDWGEGWAQAAGVFLTPPTISLNSLTPSCCTILTLNTWAGFARKGAASHEQAIISLFAVAKELRKFRVVSVVSFKACSVCLTRSRAVHTLAGITSHCQFLWQDWGWGGGGGGGGGWAQAAGVFLSRPTISLNSLAPSCCTILTLNTWTGFARNGSRLPRAKHNQPISRDERTPPAR